jgi:vacuolar-type H+-ATPase subunit H
MREVIQQIREWETEAKNIIARAEKEAQEIIALAKREVEQLKLRSQKETGEIRKTIVDKAEKDALDEVRKIQAEGKRELEALRLSIKENMPKSVDIIMERILKIDAGC